MGERSFVPVISSQGIFTSAKALAALLPQAALGLDTIAVDALVGVLLPAQRHALAADRLGCHRAKGMTGHANFLEVKAARGAALNLTVKGS
jgi:hypothetical protein